MLPNVLAGGNENPSLNACSRRARGELKFSVRHHAGCHRRPILDLMVESNQWVLTAAGLAFRNRRHDGLVIQPISGQLP